MKSRKKIIIIVVVVILFIFLACYLLLNKENNKTKKEIHYKTQEVKKIIKEKLNKIVYVYNSDVNECLLCIDPMNYFEYYRKTFNLDVLGLDYKEIKEDERKELEKLLNLDNLTSQRVSLVYIKEGQIIGQNFGEISKDSMLEDLHDKGYISDESYNEEKESANIDIYESENKMIALLIPSINDSFNDTIKLLRTISKKNKTSFRYIEMDLAINGKVRRQIREDIGEYELPSVIIIENKEIKEYTTDLSEENITSLIKK